jgi:hypothetical protein
VAPPRVCVKKEAVESGEEVVRSADEGDQGKAETKAVALGGHGARMSKGAKSKVVVVAAVMVESRLH